MSKERDVIEKTLSELEVEHNASNMDLEAMRTNRIDYSPALFEAVRNYRETLGLQIRLLRAILKEADSE